MHLSQTCQHPTEVLLPARGALSPAVGRPDMSAKATAMQLSQAPPRGAHPEHLSAPKYPVGVGSYQGGGSAERSSRRREQGGVGVRLTRPWARRDRGFPMFSTSCQRAR